MERTIDEARQGRPSEARNHAAAPGALRRGGGWQEFPLGAHLLTARRGYTHHGIYVGAGRVVHYEGLSFGLHRGPVKEVSLGQFADGRDVSVKPHPGARFSGVVAAARARSRIGEDRYRLVSNNCEHFCEWCIGGESRSEQVERFIALPRRVASIAQALLQRFSRALDGRRAETIAAG
jgi:hypothetical protein